MKRSLFIASIASLFVPFQASARKSKAKRNLRIQAMGESEDDIPVDGIFYAANISFPYETAVLTGPEFQEGTTISKCYVQGQLESTTSFVVRLRRIVDALDHTH